MPVLPAAPGAADWAAADEGEDRRSMTAEHARTGQRGLRACARAVLLLAVAAGLSACAGDRRPADPGAVTVTLTPTVTATPPKKTPTAPSPPASDVRGRAYDFGTIEALRSERGRDVVVLDRWTYRGLDDAKLARSGVPLTAFTGMPYFNQNTRLTFRIPVAADARILYHHCAAADQPLQTRSATLKELAGLKPKENLVLVRLDERGHLVAADNLPGCPD
jgi:hypothetical protein